MQSGERVEFYLDNGEKFDYLIYPGKTLSDHLMEMVALYADLTSHCSLPEEVYVRPDIMSKLNIEVYDKFVYAGLPPAKAGVSVLRFHTMVGPITVRIERRMKWPIFVGTMSEYKNNDFTELLEKVLND